MSNQNMTESETYLYLDFGGTINLEVLNGPIYLQIVNLHKKTPLIQMNEYLFKGTYDMSMGTNIFFEISENPTHSLESDSFVRVHPIHLDYVGSYTKVLNLELAKIKPRKPEISSDKLKIQYDLKWDYSILLKKFEDGTLELKDMIKKIPVEQTPEEIPVKNEEQMVVPEFVKVDNLEPDENERELQREYDKLKLIAKRPVKRQIQDEVVMECDNKYKLSYELHNLQKQVLMPSDAFRDETILELNETTLPQCIDVNRCILYGLLKPSTMSPRILSNKEKGMVLTIQNFDNLSLLARHFVIGNMRSKLEKQVANLSEDKLLLNDEYGRTPSETLEVYSKLEEVLSKKIAELKASFFDEDETWLGTVEP